MSKLLQLAPIVITTAGVTALISLRVEDDRLKKILRMIAVVLFFGSIASVASEAIKLMEQGAEAQRVIAEQQRRAQEELAKAAEASARAKQAEEVAKQAVLRAQEAELAAKLKADEVERAARLRAAEVERQARQQTERHEQTQREEAEKFRREQAIRKEQERERERRVRESEIASKRQWCRQCCESALHKFEVEHYLSGCIGRCLAPHPGDLWQTTRHCTNPLQQGTLNAVPSFSRVNLYVSLPTPG